jgi:hypothetical protein
LATVSLIDVPYFSGVGNEKVQRFLEMCRLVFVPQERYYLDANDREQAQVLFMSGKLRGSAAVFFRSLPDDKCLSWQGAIKRLRERFGQAADAVQQGKALSECASLAQGSMSLAEYTAKGQRLLDVLGPEFNTVVADLAITGLADKEVRIAVRGCVPPGTRTFRDMAAVIMRLHEGLMVERKVSSIDDDWNKLSPDGKQLLKFLAQLMNMQTNVSQNSTAKLVEALTTAIEHFSKETAAAATQLRAQQAAPPIPMSSMAAGGSQLGGTTKGRHQAQPDFRRQETPSAQTWAQVAAPRPRPERYPVCATMAKSNTTAEICLPRGKAINKQQDRLRRTGSIPRNGMAMKKSQPGGRKNDRQQTTLWLRRRVQCFCCGKWGHRAFECWHRRPTQNNNIILRSVMATESQTGGNFSSQRSRQRRSSCMSSTVQGSDISELLLG